jgi:hypothetical protein
MTAEQQRLELALRIIEHIRNESARDYQTIQELKEKIKAADELAALVEQGECPWREDTHNYHEWWEARLNAAQRYRRV